MHLATVIVRGFLDTLEALFAIGLIGSTVVLILSFVEDAKTLLE